jgi:hypothetical protein
MKPTQDMDTETISTLKTVCTAGGASPGFNGDSNARLEQLAEDGLLIRVNIPKPKGPRHAYKPTEKGKDLVRKLAAGAA